VPVTEFFGRGNCYGETGVEVLEDAVLITETSVCAWGGGGGGFCGEGAVEEGWGEGVRTGETIERGF